MKTVKLRDLAKTIRSKNAGPDAITIDIIFNSTQIYQQVKAGGSINRNTMAGIYSLPESRILSFVTYDPGNAIKFTFLRERSNGTLGESDLFGCQQYGPLIDFEVII